MARALVLRTAGTNCDLELCRAFEAAGAEVELAHLDRVHRDRGLLRNADLIGFAGGFSYGDDIASGRIFAARLRKMLYPDLIDAARRGAPMIGVCNGFQVLVQLGLLPGVTEWSDQPPEQTFALVRNSSARFVDRWTGFELDRESPCVWTRGIDQSVYGDHAKDVMLMPSAHGEGRLIAANESVLRDVVRNGQAVIRYAENFNGSAEAIAGLCDPSGLIFGMMPHPERYLRWEDHPYWTRLPSRLRELPTPGALMFEGAIAAALRETDAVI